MRNLLAARLRARLSLVEAMRLADDDKQRLDRELAEFVQEISAELADGEDPLDSDAMDEIAAQLKEKADAEARAAARIQAMEDMQKLIGEHIETFMKTNKPVAARELKARHDALDKLQAGSQALRDEIVSVEKEIATLIPPPHP